MCCKLLRIEELKKPLGAWCKHVLAGKGCKIYDERPIPCRNFHCYWILNPNLGTEWKPDKSKFIIWQGPTGAWTISVDPGNPNAWRQSKYLSQIRLLAAQLAEQGQVLVLPKGDKMICILPDREVELPKLEDGQGIAVASEVIGARTHYEVVIGVVQGSGLNSSGPQVQESLVKNPDFTQP